jgi:hypothetical protein
MYLVDTNVISARVPARPVPLSLTEWMDTHFDWARRKIEKQPNEAQTI